MYLLIALAYVLVTALVGGIGDYMRFTSLAGYVAFLLIMYIFSAHRRAVRARPIICGLLIQYTMGLLILKTLYVAVVECLSSAVSLSCLSDADVGPIKGPSVPFSRSNIEYSRVNL